MPNSERFPPLRRKAAALLLPALLAAAAPALAPAQPVGLPDLGDSASQELSPRLEQRLGDAIMMESLRDPAYIDDPDLTQYLTGIAGQLSAQAPAGTPSINVFAVRDPSINAFAMPGGYIGVHTGLVVAAQSESELAGVLAHEIGHVVQRHIARGLVQQKRDSLIMVAALLAALVAARGNSQAPEAAMAFGQAAAINSQLGFSREAEREADRTGFQMLETAGYNVNGMAAFFGRLMQASGLNESTSQAFTRTHPLSIERMSDMQNRARGVVIHDRSNSPDFYFVRAKMRMVQASSGQDAREAIRYFESRTADLQGIERSAAYYGAALGYMRQREYGKANDAYLAATSGARTHFMLERLAVDLALARNDTQQAIALARGAVARWPEQRGPAMAMAEALQRAGRNQEAVEFLKEQMLKWSDEPRFYQMAAVSYSRLGSAVNERRNMADYYAMTGALPAAVEQLQQARAASKDFYEQSQIDAKVREYQRRLKEERDLLKRFQS
ncbi:M48 family metalloprotease [Pigmentiphaga sp.]|uniref:M48 family metalloprotease n=1 Tax=Pigmentiphaga sp. TaxID=1977564 RepID=UPI00128DB9CB|nr:M48 family metalloprotease [Pigmentiphaga sp.]MPS29906.1 peptidase [Alcaligenaceae bacterium SAGV5]MPS55152.1 peptidase [Alcaligenaceae bacterium SAGV3]MPT58373.1 peptidase [Alcaligenaceae bacterium]